MKIKTETCPECGEPLRGIVETVRGCAILSDPDEQGRREYWGETDIWWDDQGPVPGEEVNTFLVICNNGHEWYSHIDFEDQSDEDLLAPKETP